MQQTLDFLRFSALIMVLFICATTTFAQTTQFTYQGRFTDSTLPQPTNGTFEMQFKVFDSATNGNQIDSTLTLPTVQVVNGIFTVTLDYGATTFRGQDIFLEIGVRPVASANPFTVLNPRQKFASAPYAIQSFNSRNASVANDSVNLGGVPANQYVQVNDSRLSDARTPTAGSPFYVQNGTAQQSSSNFNISNDGTLGGTLTANIVKATTQFNIGTNRVLSVGSGNTFAGVNTGTVTTGGDNTFVGTNAGMTNITGFNNAFFGTDAGRTNTATNNSFFGRSSGFATTTGGNNSFFGLDAGRFNTLGGNNAFFGLSAGQSNTIGNNNTALGNSANFTVNNLNFATAIGSGSVVSTSNTLMLGRTLDTVIAPNLLQVDALGAAGATSLCRNASNQISTCSGGSGGGSFINNGTVQQAASNFNISNDGTIGGLLSANIVNSTTNYRIGGTTVFSTPNGSSVVVGQFSNHALGSNNNAFFGFKAGSSTNNFSQANTFIGSDSGELTTSGGNNSFVGRDAGFANTSGSQNSFFGSGAGQTNSSANANSFFGYFAGNVNSTGTRNSFFGFQSGLASQTVNDNSFFGYQSGSATTGGRNSFFGSLAGKGNNTGTNNSFFGNSSGLVNNGGFENSFFGNSSGLANNGGSENAFYGSSAGLVNTSGSQNTFLGNKSGSTNTVGNNNTFIGYQASGTNGDQNTVIGSSSAADGNQNTMLGGGSSSTGNTNTSIGYFTSVDGSNNTVVGSGTKVQPFTPGFPGPTFATAIGAGTVANLSNSVFIGRDIDIVRIPGGLNAESIFASSVLTGSLEITGSTKLVIASFTNTGTIPLCRNSNNLISNCPTSFAGKSTGLTNEQNTQIATQAEEIKRQQTTIGKQAEQIKLMQTQMEALKEAVCAMNPTAKICEK